MTGSGLTGSGLTGAVLAIGSELLLGDVINSNAAWLGHQLSAAGVDIIASEALADAMDRLVPAIRRHLSEVDVLILSGGLGPTVDDLTRDAVAAALDLELVRHPDLVEQLESTYASYGMTSMPAEVLRQADVPVGAVVLDNPVGTAPGLWIESPLGIVVALPGPPHELQAVSAAVWPRLAAMSGQVITTRQVLVSGLGESLVAERVEGAVELPAEVALSYLAGGAIVRVRFTSADASLLGPLVAAADAALGEHVWGHDRDTLDSVVHGLLDARGQTLAVAESLTGGLLGAALSTMPGSSATFRGSAVVYATDLKASLAGVPQEVLDEHGAVSAETAAALARGVRIALGSDWGVGVTGVAGPASQEGKPVGTVHLAVQGPHASEVRSLRLPGDRDRVRQLAVTMALDLLRRNLAR